MAHGPLMALLGFNVVVFALLVADLLLFHRRPHALGMREALGWSGFWIGLALAFNALLYPAYSRGWMGLGAAGGPHAISGADAALQFLTAYLIELSLSVDNLFVFLAIFGYFRVRGEQQHRVLFWGIVGAVVLRAVMILAGVALLERFHWLLYVLGGFLILTGGRLALTGDEGHVDPERNLVLRIARRLLPMAPGDHGGRFLLREGGRLLATPLLLVLLVVETTDLVFALDSIPAVLAITRDPFLAYTSNILAVLGLRAMYFALAGLMGRFRYLRLGLAAVLVFVGVKMLAPAIGLGHVPVGVSLLVVATLLGLSIVASFLLPGKGSQAHGGNAGGR